jgi:hypothetical protein
MPFSGRLTIRRRYRQFRVWTVASESGDLLPVGEESFNIELIHSKPVLHSFTAEARFSEPAALWDICIQYGFQNQSIAEIG